MKQEQATKLVFAVEPITADLFNELPGLLDLHWQEVAEDKKIMRLEPDLDYYLSNKDILLVTARVEGRIVGYCVFWLHTHPHYKSVLVAQSDIYYLSPEYRSGLNGFDLLEKGLQFAKAAGARYAFVGTKVGHDHPEIMQHLGLKPRDLIYGGPL